jgi:hypothetical protein
MRLIIAMVIIGLVIAIAVTHRSKTIQSSQRGTTIRRITGIESRPVVFLPSLLKCIFRNSE